MRTDYCGLIMGQADWNKEDQIALITKLVVAALNTLDWDQRQKVFSNIGTHFCIHCGDAIYRGHCNCQRDE